MYQERYVGRRPVDKVFFGYASRPPLTCETLGEAVRAIRATGVVDAVSWEDLKVAGRVIIRQIMSEIDASAACVFDVSTLNENVMFELGYTIAREKPLMILLDKTDNSVKRTWQEFQLLKNVGYVGWANSEEIKGCFLKARPDQQSGNLYRDLIEKALTPMLPASLFYVQSYHPTDATQQISRRLDQEIRKGIKVVSHDPTESSLNSLQWYATQTYAAECAIVHFDAPRRELASLHNPRSALIAGLAVGWERPVLMLAEEDYSAPLDYEEYLKPYKSKTECLAFLNTWLQDIGLKPKTGSRIPKIRLAGELRSLRFGEHVAENERDSLSDYYVETSAFNDVISNRTTLFVGRKGTGKTATMYQAASRLATDARNIVVTIKPASYEFSTLLTQLTGLNAGLKQYSIEALWKFLLVSEIAKVAVENLEARPIGVPFSESERKLLAFVDGAAFELRSDFSTRFERTVGHLVKLGLDKAQNAGDGRDMLNEALHSQAIARLRSLLGAVLGGRRRVAILIDNLDKGWDRSADLDTLSQLLLGLLAAIGRLEVDFAKEDYWRDKISLTVATFLRKDIYEYMRTVAREPDKIVASIVAWSDQDILLRMLEERFLAVRPDGTSADELWERFVAPNIDGVPTREWVPRQILPRPRDLIFLANSAVVYAIDRGHSLIEEADWKDALLAYSQFAFEALLVENGITIGAFKEVLYEFLGADALITEERVLECIRAAHIDEKDVHHLLDRLQEVSFLGVEVGQNQFEYPETDTPFERALVMARKYSERQESDGTRFSIHPAYRPYLEIT
jgi:hypothetical protein